MNDKWIYCLAAAGLGMFVGFAVVEYREVKKAEIDSQYEFISRLPTKPGMYKFYDIPEQKVCYLLFGDTGRGAISCESVDPDLKADPSAIRE